MSAKLRRRILDEKTGKETTEKYPDNLAFDEDAQVYVWRERIRGANYWRSTGTDKIGLARQMVKVFRSEATGTPTERLRHTFAEAFDIVLTIQAAKAPKTLEMARAQINHLAPWFAEHCAYLSDFERRFEEVWSRYKADQDTLTPGRKLTHDRRHLLMALKRAKDKGWVTREFKKRDFQLLEASEPVGRILEQDELDRLLRETADNGLLHIQVLMAVLMGMRLREVLHLRWDEVDLKRGVIGIKGARVKTRLARTVPIHVNVLKALKRWREMQKELNAESAFVFPARGNLNAPQDSNKKAWAAALDRAKVKARFHDLRHTAISFMVSEGIPDLLVSKITGASLKVIQRVYLHMNLDVTEKVRNLRCGKIVGLE
jgi:integrase